MAIRERLRIDTRATLCLECGKCSTLCPLAGFGGFSAARMIAVRGATGEPDSGLAAVERCLTCAACETRCPQGVHFTDFVRGVRPLVSLPGRSCPHGRALQSAARLGAGEGAPHRAPGWLGDGLRVAEEGDVALFVGCLPQFETLFGRDLELPLVEIARSAVRLLNRVGVEPVLVEDERCCGHDLLWRGESEPFAALAAANAEAFRRRGVRHIVTTCAECCRTWRLDYGEAVPDYRPRVEHLSEFLAKRLDEGGLAFRNGDEIRVTYQDPCRLGRQLGVFEEPRRVLESLPGVGLAEMERSGPDAVCCGTCGFVRCDAVSRALQLERLQSAGATGASALITACPKCLIHFRCAAAGERRRGLESPGPEPVDFARFLDSRLEPEPAGEAGAETTGGGTG